MPAALVAHVRTQGAASADCEGGEEPIAAGSGMERIFELLRSVHGIDFAHYKPSTVMRRIERRIAMGSAADVDEYAARLMSSPVELNTLYQDLLIGVTRFFRDPEAFSLLEHQVVPAILAATSSREEIRVWCAGCATGEEAYSLGILFHEQLQAAGRPLHLKIFATDVHRSSLDVASAGVHDEESVSAVSPARRERYFLRRDGGYQVTKDLRQLIVFAPHNIISDAPFTRLDLLTCRNLLIYLQPPAQHKAMSLFHFGLKTGGHLFLGPSESPGELGEEFEPIDKQWKIYRKRRELRLPAIMRMPAMPAASGRGRQGGWSAPVSDGTLLGIYDRLLGRCMPASLLVDEHHNLLHSFAGAERFIRFPGGRPSSNVLDLLPAELRTPVSAALQHASKEQKLVRYSNVTSRGEEEHGNLSVQVEPVTDERSRCMAFLVSLEPVDQPSPRPSEAPIEVDPNGQDRVEALEQELRFTKESLQATIEELETSNEELQATNEELVAANEELQSTNEELHSVNEELYTVNAELQRKIAELTEMTADLDSVLQTSEVGVLFLDRQLCIRKFTAKVMDAFQLLPQDTGRSIESFSPRLDYPELLDDIRRVLHGGRPVDREVDGADGHFYYVRVLPYQQAGTIAGVVVTLLDIAALRSAERSSRILAAVVESSADAIIAADLSGRITHWNRGAGRMYGFTAAEMIGAQLRRIVPLDRQEEFGELLAEVRRGELREYLETVRRRCDGSLLYVSLQVSPIRGRQGEVVGISTIERDITTRRRAEEQSQLAVQQREQFLAVLSHELRNPLAAAVNATRILQKEDQTDALRRRALVVLERQTGHMARLLDDLLDISRLRQGKLDIQKEDVDLRDAAEAALETVGALIEERGIDLEVDLGDGPLPVIGDPHRLRQLLVNLLSNAARHTDAGRRVWLTLCARGQQALIEVQDEGEGIAAELLPRIFEPFARSPARGRPSEGLGVGLWLVRSIVDAHGGTVSARSEGPGTGAQFCVGLPLAACAAPSRTLEEDDVLEARLVLVEDHKDAQELLAAILSGAGLSVLTADDGERGIELIERHRPGVALVDLGLPGMSGLEVAARLRRKFGPDELRLVALTGFGQQADRQAVYEAGFDQHLVKPVDVDALLRLLRAELGRLRPATGGSGKQ
jgi:two-component system CheB/CheR fusion protein